MTKSAAVRHAELGTASVAEFLQFLFSGITVGAIYALVGVGFAIIYSASNVINFAQGEFVMLGGMATMFLLSGGEPLWLAALLAIVITAAIGLALNKFAVEPAAHRRGGGASVVTLIIITIGASIFIRGAAEVLLGKDSHRLPAFSGDQPIDIFGAKLDPQVLWVLGALALAVVGLRWFFARTRLGKAMLATSCNRLAAELVGIDVRMILLASFGLSAALGALAGILTAPITLTRYDIGIMLGLKGFCAAILGGLGSPFGAVAGGLLLGIAEAMAAGYLSSAYKDVVAFVIILAVLFLAPGGLFGAKATERV
ncbi:MAG: branched-chain amino acid ABC transporter permease [Proteobacteria bacterium]|nr:branched-chain amino acid ABC transporter permease [Pseudomonadota bacterium]